VLVFRTTIVHKIDLIQALILYVCLFSNSSTFFKMSFGQMRSTTLFRVWTKVWSRFNVVLIMFICTLLLRAFWFIIKHYNHQTYCEVIHVECEVCKLVHVGCKETPTRSTVWPCFGIWTGSQAEGTKLHVEDGLCLKATFRSFFGRTRCMFCVCHTTTGRLLGPKMVNSIKCIFQGHSDALPQWESNQGFETFDY